VKRTPAGDIIEFLSFSGPCDRISSLDRLRHRGWEKALRWLDDAGLAFYFLQRLKDTNSAEVIPTAVFSRLEKSFTANRERVEHMSGRFDFLNRKLNAAGIRYAVLKGISLVPQFCPYAPLRHQGDFDYLVDAQSLSAAQRILVEAGYTPKNSRSSQEFIFVIPGTRAPSRSPEQYSARAPHAVELHLDIWDGNMHGLPSISNLFSVGRARTREWNGFAFPALTDEDAFLLQVLHACHHLFNLWIRMSCLFEIGYFLSRRANDTELWSRIEQRVGDNLLLREFVVVVCELAAKLFAPPLPPLVQVWGARIRPEPRVWIEEYARSWAFSELPVYQFSLFPRSKLVLFLKRQYGNDASLQRPGITGVQLPPGLLRIASSVRNNPSLVLNAGWWKRQLLLRRSVFYALSGLRYLCEIPRWLWLTRTKMRSTP
jgi:hypothetical protein